MKRITKILAVSMVILLFSAQMSYASMYHWLAHSLPSWGSSVYRNQLGSAGRFVKKSIIQDRMKNFPANGSTNEKVVSAAEIKDAYNQATTQSFLDNLQKGGVNTTSTTGEFLRTLVNFLSRGNSTAQKTQPVSGNSTAQNTQQVLQGTYQGTYKSNIQRNSNMRIGHETIEQNIDLTPIILKQQ